MNKIDEGEREVKAIKWPTIYIADQALNAVTCLWLMNDQIVLFCNPGDESRNQAPSHVVTTSDKRNVVSMGSTKFTDCFEAST
jgi:hypothetical protein